MAVSDFFRGKALNGIDKKGRVSVPSDFRATIQTRHRRAIVEDGFDPAAEDATKALANAGRVVIVRKDPARPCLIAFETSFSRVEHANIIARHADQPAAEREAAIARDMRVFGKTEDLAWDVNGRIVLGPRLCAKIGIDPETDNGVDNKVCFYGLGPTFEIWHPERLAEALEADGEEDDAEDIRALIEEKRA